jgi:quercetin dioxygenase-like cupin family protein
LASGKGILQYDEHEYEMNPGDISLCKIGHAHGFIATQDCVLIVVGNS